jgi:hypothetical protein
LAELTEEMRISCRSSWPAAPEADIELQDKILDKILEEVGGWKVSVTASRTWPSSPTCT